MPVNIRPPLADRRVERDPDVGAELRDVAHPPPGRRRRACPGRESRSRGGRARRAAPGATYATSRSASPSATNAPCRRAAAFDHRLQHAVLSASTVEQRVEIHAATVVAGADDLDLGAGGPPRVDDAVGRGVRW